MRLYFNFETNIPDTVKDRCTVQVERFTFKEKDGNEIEVLLDGEADYGVENGVDDARWKGLEFIFKDADGEDIYLSDDDENASESAYWDVLNRLMASEPASIAYNWEDMKYWNIPSEDFVPTCKKLSITLEDEYRNVESLWECSSLCSL